MLGNSKLWYSDTQTVFRLRQVTPGVDGQSITASPARSPSLSRISHTAAI